MAQIKQHRGEGEGRRIPPQKTNNSIEDLVGHEENE
jgi:hypothetical protein